MRFPLTRSTKIIVSCWLAAVCCVPPLCAQPLAVYDTPHFQSPVRGAPGDLLMVAGEGFAYGARAFYQYAPDPTSPPPPPSPLPSLNTEWSGELYLPDLPATDLDAYVNVPDSLTMELPPAMEDAWPYAIHVLNPGGEWSDPVFVNDPRPLWLSPDFAYQTAQTGSSPRKLRVIGRNLVPLHEDPMLVRLTGPEVYEIFAPSAVPTGALDHYLVEVDLPAYMVAGQYRADVMREGVWFPVVHGSFEVLDDPLPLPLFPVTSYGGCQPNDGQDDTACVQAAIDAAFGAGGGEVFFAAGRWDLRYATQTGKPYPDLWGILLRPGVDLVGASAASTWLVKHPSWTGHTVITLEGSNEVRGLHMTEETYGQAPTVTSFLRLGKLYMTVPARLHPQMEVRDVVIHQCKLTEMYYGIGEGGFRMRRIHVTDNEFQAFHNALYLAGDPALKSAPFSISDSVIARNLFLPGDHAEGTQGTIASEIGASEGVDFSGNVADGTVNGGWRAAFFWHMEGNNERLLVSGNLATCTGDKAGDGEALAMDANRNVVGFEGSQLVQAAAASWVEVAASWIEPTPGFYDAAWVAVVKGPGVGQARKVVATTPGPSPVITVSPPWDVAPTPGRSEIVVTRAYWSNYVVDNEVDNRPAIGCLATNPKGQEGVLGNNGWTLDSAFEGNRQYASGGIHISKSHAALQPDGSSWSMGIYASEVRGNLLDGEAPSAPDGKGGIELWYGSAAGEPGIVMSHNLAISHNTVIDADGSLGGGIATRLSWSASTDPWALTTLHVFRNHVQDVDVGIFIDSNPSSDQTWRSVLYDNTYANVGTQVIDNGTETVLLP